VQADFRRGSLKASDVGLPSARTSFYLVGFACGTVHGVDIDRQPRSERRVRALDARRACAWLIRTRCSTYGFRSVVIRVHGEGLLVTCLVIDV
jgi:hypothetical protein